MNEEVYCYWSIGRGEEAMLLRRCLDSAQRHGVKRRFHFFCDQPIPGCDCYAAMQCEVIDGYEPLIYLRTAVSKLPYKYFVWIDPGTVFLANPSAVIEACSKSPIHVPLEKPLSRRATATGNTSRNAESFRRNGVTSDIYAHYSAFWIIKRKAIDYIYNLVVEFQQKTRAEGVPLDWHGSLGYAMHMLGGDLEKHLVTARPDLWAPALRDREALDGERPPLEAAASITLAPDDYKNNETMPTEEELCVEP